VSSIDFIGVFRGNCSLSKSGSPQSRKGRKGSFCLWPNRERRLGHNANPLRDRLGLVHCCNTGKDTFHHGQEHFLFADQRRPLAASHRQIKNDFSASFVPCGENLILDRHGAFVFEFVSSFGFDIRIWLRQGRIGRRYGKNSGCF